MQTLNAGLLLALLAAQAPQSSAQVLGDRRPVSTAAFLQRGEWIALPDGARLWRSSVHSAGAAAIRLHFQNFQVGAGRVRVHGLTPAAVEDGPFSARGRYGDGDFWTRELDGDTAVVEYQPPDGAGRDAPALEVTELVHVWPDTRTDPRSAGASAKQLPTLFSASTGERAVSACHKDVSCYQQYQKQADAVVFVRYLSGSIYRNCSGVILQDKSGNPGAYLLTSHRCVADDDTAKLIQVYWRFQTSACNGSAPSPVNVPSVAGGRLIDTRAATEGDFSLIHLDSVPAVAAYAELATTELAAGATVYGIHHPDGSYKRVALGTRAADRDVVADGVKLPAGTYYQVTWGTGQVESGSSGSPLFNDAGQVAGILGPAYPPSIGQVGCDVSKTVSTYGRMSVIAPLLQRYLNPSEAEPTVLTLSPTALTAGTGEASLLVRGMGFTAGSAVLWNEAPLPTTFSTAQSLRAQVDGALVAQPGTVKIAVKRPDGKTSNVVDLVVETPKVTLGTATVAVAAEVGGVPPAAQTVQITSVPSGLTAAISVEYESAGGWLQATADRTATPVSLALQTVPGLLAPGTYRAAVKIAVPGLPTPASLPVTLDVSRTIRFLYGLGTEAPQPKCFNPAVADGEPFSTGTSGEPWLIVQPAQAAAPAPVCIGIVPDGLAEGTYSGTVTVQPGGLPLDVVLTVTPPPQLTLGAESLAFSYVPGTTLSARKVTVRSVNPTAGLPFSWSVPAESAWLSVAASSSVTPADLTVTAKPAGLAPGLYTSRVTVAAAGASGDPRTVEVTLQVPEVRLDAAPSAPTLIFETGASTLPAQSLRILAQTASGNAAKIAFTATPQSEGDWLQVDLRSATTPRDLRITIKPVDLPVGEYTGVLLLESADAVNTPRTIPVVLRVVGAAITVDPASFQLETIAGARQLIQKQITVTRGSAGTELPFFASVDDGASWLAALAPAAATTPNSIRMTVNGSDLAPGVYSSAVVVTSSVAGNTPLRVPVTLTVRDRPEILASPASLTFTAQAGYRMLSSLPLAIAGGGAAFTITFYTTDGRPWLSLDKTSGQTPATVQVSADPQGLPAGTYGGIIRIESSDASNKAQVVLVTMVITKSPSPVVTPSEIRLEGQSGTNRILSGTLQMATNGDSIYATAMAAEGGEWLSVSPLVSAIGILPGDPAPHPGTLTYFADLRGVPAGVHKGRIELALVSNGTPIAEIPVTLTLRSSAYVVPRWVSGNRWTSSLTLTNTDNQPAGFQVQFRDVQGARQLVSLAGLGRLSELTDTIPAGGTRVIATDDSSGEQAEGWVQLSVGRGVNGFAVLTRGRQYGDTETVVPLSGNAGNALLLPYDNTGGFSTELTLTNPSESASGATIRVRDEEGQVLDTFTTELEPGRQTVLSLKQISEAAAAGRGLVEIDASDAPIAATALRVDDAGAFTLLPVAPPPAATSATASLIVPYVANGGSWQTATLLWNPSSRPAPYYARWRLGDGVAINIPMPKDASPMEFFDVIPPWGTRLLPTNGLGDALLTAQCEIFSAAPVQALSLLQQGLDTVFYSERTVPAAAPANPPVLIAFDNREGVSTAIVVANGSTLHKLPYFLVLRDEAGRILTYESRPLAPGAHEMLDVASQYPETRGRIGVIEISGGPVSAVGLRSTAGGALTVLPALSR